MPRLSHVIVLLLVGTLLATDSAAALAQSQSQSQSQTQTQTQCPAPAALRKGELRLTYLGNAGWEISDGRRVVLVDPFLTQFRRRRPGGTDVAPAALYVPDSAFIDAQVRRADYILITHGHSDHALDAGYIARRAGAVIVGYETAANLARAYDVPDSSLITVIGGEDYDFGDFSLCVVPNIHSALDDKRYYNNGRGIASTAPRGLRAPLRRVDYQEGGNLAYLPRMAGHEVLIMGSMNYIKREREGLRPDVALIGSNSQRREIHDYTGRLMRALGNPAVVLPSHSDAYGDSNPSAAALADRRQFQQEVSAASPTTRFISPTWFEPIVLPPRATTGGHTVVTVPGLAPLVPAYSAGIRAGAQVFVSGLTGIKPGTQEIIDGGWGPQTRQTLENIRTLLEAAGATMAQITECAVFLVDMTDYAAMNGAYIEFFRTAPPPRATLAVTALPRPAARVEIKCSAVVPD